MSPKSPDSSSGKQTRKFTDIIRVGNGLKNLHFPSGQSSPDVQLLAMNKSATPPLHVIEWNDTETDAKGWLVIDTIVNSLCGGGIFMHPGASEEEVTVIARSMSKKFSVCPYYLGGAKAGIKFDHHDTLARSVLRRFILAMGEYIKTTWITAGDLNTSDMFIESVIRDDLGLETGLTRLGYVISQDLKHKNLTSQAHTLISFAVSKYFPLVEAAVGYGLAISIQTAAQLRNAPLRKETPFSTVESVPEVSRSRCLRVIIQGFGAVGSSLAYYLETLGIANVVGIADKDGFAYSKDGICIKKILEKRAKMKQRLIDTGAPLEDINECGKNLIVNISGDDQHHYVDTVIDRKSEENDREFLSSFLKHCEAEVFCPAAGRYQLTVEIIDVLESYTWLNAKERYLISGANNPFGNICPTSGELEEDKSGGVIG